jgi:acetyl-CoA C-acetyltransferase
MNSIIAYHSTVFGELWERSLYDLVEEAINGVIKEAGIEKQEIDVIFYGNMLGGIIDNNLHATAKIAEIMGVHSPVYRLEAACASGGMAFQMGHTYLNSNPNKTVLVIGAEKMTDINNGKVAAALSAAASGEEQAAGLTFPGLYGMMARYYLDKYGYNEENFAHVAVKNHFHGTLNKKAQFRKEITVQQVMKSPYVATPLKLLDSSPITDGAAAVILTNKPELMKKNPVTVLSSKMATDTISLKHRKYIDRLEATIIAAEKAYKNAGITAKDIDVAELHDCFTIAELLAMEDLGFWKKGEAGAMIKTGETTYGSNGKLIVNTSGGLKAAGHPVGATGIKQIGEIYHQLTGKAENRQVKNAKYGLAHNVGGSGGTAVVTILGK